MIVPSSTAKCSTWDLPLLLLYSKAKKRIGSLNSVLHNGSFDLKMTTWGIRRTIFIFKSQFVRVALYLLNGLRTLFFPSSRLQKLSSEAFILAVPSGLKRHSSSEQDTLVQLLGDWEEDERETRPTRWRSTTTTTTMKIHAPKTERKRREDTQNTCGRLCCGVVE